MTTTREQLVLRALREVGAAPAGQAPAPEDSQAMDDEVESLMADLAQRNVWTWGDPDRIDDAAAIHLAKLLANSAARQFGLSPDEAIRLYSEARLIELRSVIDAGDPIVALYF